MKRRQFTEAFKRRAVKRVEGMTGELAAAKLKIDQSMVYNWRKRFTASEASQSHRAKNPLGGFTMGNKPLIGKPSGAPLEAIVYLRHAKRAWDSGNAKKGELLARLALVTLEEK